MDSLSLQLDTPTLVSAGQTDTNLSVYGCSLEHIFNYPWYCHSFIFLFPLQSTWNIDSTLNQENESELVSLKEPGSLRNLWISFISKTFLSLSEGSVLFCFVFQLSHPYFRFFSIVYSQTKSYLIMRFCAASVRLFEYIYKLMYFNWNSMKDRSVMNYRVYKIEVKQGKVYNIENSGKKHIRSKWFSVWTVWKLSCSPDNLNM